MQELEKRIGLLRLMLADIVAKKAQLSEMEKQYRAQLSRIVEFVVYREGDVANALSLMSEVDGKLGEVLSTEAHLQMIESRASTELDVLVLTKRISDARSQLAHLEERQKELGSRLMNYTGSEPDNAPTEPVEPEQIPDIGALNEEVAQVTEEIARLNQLITDASARAARSVQA